MYCIHLRTDSEPIIPRLVFTHMYREHCLHVIRSSSHANEQLLTFPLVCFCKIASHFLMQVLGMAFPIQAFFIIWDSIGNTSFRIVSCASCTRQSSLKLTAAGYCLSKGQNPSDIGIYHSCARFLRNNRCWILGTLVHVSAMVSLVPLQQCSQEVEQLFKSETIT